MKIMHKFFLTLGVIIFVSTGLGVAGGLSIIWIRWNADELEMASRQAALIDNLRSKTSQWVVSAEFVGKDVQFQDFFHLNTLLLEESISLLMAERLPVGEKKTLEAVSIYFNEIKGQIRRLPGEEKSLKIRKISDRSQELLRHVKTLMDSHKLYLNEVKAKADRTKNIGKYISIALPSVCIILAVSFGLTIGRSIIRSVEFLVSAARAMAMGDLSRKVALKSNDEFGEIANAFDIMREELKTKSQKLEQLSITDELTGLFNRRYLNHKIEEELIRAKRLCHNLTILFIDIDHFKEFNDFHGHQEGDKVIKELCKVITRNIRDKVDTACRYGGEEFVVILPETYSKRAVPIAERIRIRFGEIGFKPPPVADFIYNTVSIGISEYREDETSDVLLKRADEAMYEAKHEGRNRIIVL